MQKQSTQTNSTLSIGIDVDSHKSVIAVLDLHTGVVIYEKKVAHTRKAWKKVLNTLPEGPKWACYETGSLGFWLCRMLRELGIDCEVVAATAVPKEPERRQRKNDHLDAMTLALMYYHPPRSYVRIPTPLDEDHRELIRTREQCLNQRVRVINQIRSKLRFHGIMLDTNTLARSKRWIDEVRSLLPEDTCLEIAIDALLTQLQTLTEQIQRLECALRALARTEQYAEDCARLEAIPGVGTITAMAFLTEVFRPEDFPTPDKLMSHLGLVPCEWSSGASLRNGHITRWGPAHLRRFLVEAAWTWVRRDSDATRCFEAHCQGRVQKKDIVAMARRLATAMWAMTVRKQDYNFHWGHAA